MSMTADLKSVCRKLGNERTVCTECNLQNFHNKNKDQAFQNSGFYISKLFFPQYITSTTRRRLKFETFLQIFLLDFKLQLQH